MEKSSNILMISEDAKKMKNLKISIIDSKKYVMIPYQEVALCKKF